MCGKQELNGADSAPVCPLCKGFGTMRGGDEEVPCPKCSRPTEATFSEWMAWMGWKEPLRDLDRAQVDSEGYQP